MQMVASDNHDGLVDDPIEDAVGETGNKRPSCLPVNDRVGHGRADNIPDCHAYSAEEAASPHRPRGWVTTQAFSGEQPRERRVRGDRPPATPGWAAHPLPADGLSSRRWCPVEIAPARRQGNLPERSSKRRVCVHGDGRLRASAAFMAPDSRPVALSCSAHQRLPHPAPLRPAVGPLYAAILRLEAASLCPWWASPTTSRTRGLAQHAV